MQFVEELLTLLVELDATRAGRTYEGRKCLKEIADHFKGIGTAIERYRRELEPPTVTQSVTVGTLPSKFNRS